MHRSPAPFFLPAPLRPSALERRAKTFGAEGVAVCTPFFGPLLPSTAPSAASHVWASWRLASDALGCTDRGYTCANPLLLHGSPALCVETANLCRRPCQRPSPLLSGGGGAWRVLVAHGKFRTSASVLLIRLLWRPVLGLPGVNRILGFLLMTVCTRILDCLANSSRRRSDPFLFTHDLF